MAEKASGTQSMDGVSSPPAAGRGRLPSNSAKGICMEKVTRQGFLLKRLSSGMLVDLCSHPYCSTCILCWARTANTCPLCKGRFNAVRRKSARGRRGVLETIKVEHKDPTTDVAAAFAGWEEVGAGRTRRRKAHGYELDDFVVSGREEGWGEEGEDWQASPVTRISDGSTRSSGRNRPRTRALGRRGEGNAVGSAELRQLQQEAARVLGDSPLRSRRRRPAYSTRGSAATPAHGPRSAAVTPRSTARASRKLRRVDVVKEKEEDDNEEEFEWEVGNAPSVAKKDDRERGHETGGKRAREESSSDDHGVSRARPRLREAKQ